MESGVIHIVSEIGGCIIGRPLDTEGIIQTLRSYARRQGMEFLELMEPLNQDLGEWAHMAQFAICEYGIEGPVLVGAHECERVLLGVSKRYGYPMPGVPLDDIIEVVQFPKRTRRRRVHKKRVRKGGGRLGTIASATSESITQDRFRGCLLGLAAGDALGTTLEFFYPGTFQPIDDMVGGGWFDLDPGQWTDDTSMALCLAQSLIERSEFDPMDQMQRYVMWRNFGFLSSTGHGFGIGNTVADALSRFDRTGDPYAGSSDPLTAGNGSLMRLAPVPMYFAGDAAEAIDRSGDSSRTTHGAREAVDACRYFSGLLVGALQGVDKETLLYPGYSPVEGLWEASPLAEKIGTVAGGSFKDLEPPEIQGSGYVVKSLEAALWAFHKSQDFRSGALLAVNLGYDADTTGAIYGQIAGAHYGIDAIPVEWRERLSMGERIISMADSLYEHARISLPVGLD